MEQFSFHDKNNQTKNLTEVAVRSRILVVDDFAPNVELLEALLVGAGYDISMAFSGEEALAKALAEQPDLVLLDVMMPGMNGFEVCEKLKQAELTRFIPVVLLTALDQIEDKIRGLDAGADDFLTKPFNKVELMARVRSLLRIRALSVQIEQKNLLLFRLLNRYVSEEIVTEILTDPEQHLKLGGAKKDVVVLFADIRGFTAFSEGETAEKVVEVLNECFRHITEVIFKHRGTFDKYLGDCVLAFYGAPLTWGDDLERALLTAIEMQQVFQAMHSRWTEPQMQALGLGIGINCGEVVVGNIGSERLMDYTVIGDNVNLAQRLEQIAQHGQIVISEEVYRRACHLVTATEMSPVLVKGKREPVTAYLVEGLRNRD